MLLPRPQVVGLRMRGCLPTREEASQDKVGCVHCQFTKLTPNASWVRRPQTVEIYLLLRWQLRQDGPTGRRSWAGEAESMWFSCVVLW